jgi:N-acetylmuramic acid 6-phosphate etherase
LSKEKVLFDQLQRLATEQRNPASMDIDTRSIEEILILTNNEDKKIAFAVETQIPYITKAVEMVVETFRNNGRLLYAGAGTSGRLGVLDAVECPPTFGTDPELIQGVIAGGEKAMFRAQEGAEDREESGASDMDYKKIGKKDIVCGIAASLRTPYVVGAVKRAKQLGARTLYVTTNPRSSFQLPEYSDLASSIDVAICPEVGPEIIMGSTRMKSGTAQKLILNMITTAAMIRLGKVYENMMIDLQTTNLKLHERAKRIVMMTTGVSYSEATEALTKSSFQVKTTLVMIKANVTPEEAQQRLKKSNGFVRAAIAGNDSCLEQSERR